MDLIDLTIREDRGPGEKRLTHSEIANMAKLIQVYDDDYAVTIFLYLYNEFLFIQNFFYLIS